MQLQFTREDCKSPSKRCRIRTNHLAQSGRHKLSELLVVVVVRQVLR